MASIKVIPAVVIPLLMPAGAGAQDMASPAPPPTVDAATQAASDRATAQLFEAVQANDLNLVQASVASGANIRAIDRWGLTPAEIAVDKGNFDIAHFLISIQNAQRASAISATTHRAPAPLVAPPAAAPAPPLAKSPLTYRHYSTTQRMDPSRSAPERGANETPGPFDPNTPVIGGDLRPAGDTATAPPSASGGRTESVQ